MFGGASNVVTPASVYFYNKMTKIIMCLVWLQKKTLCPVQLCRDILSIFASRRLPMCLT